MWQKKTKKWLTVFIIVDISLFIAIAVVVGLMVFNQYFAAPEKQLTEQMPTGQRNTKPLRIVSMAPNITEILYELGLGDHVTGVTRYSNYPPEVTLKPCVGTFWQPDIEAILKADPSMVITLGFEQQNNLAQRLDRLGAKTLRVPIESIDDLFGAIHSIGLATNQEQKAMLLVGRLQVKRNQLRKKYAAYPPARVLWVIQREPLRVAGQRSYVNELLKLLNCENVMTDTIAQYPQISAEKVLAAAPDIIIEPVDDAARLNEQQATAGNYYVLFKATPAVRQNRVYIVDGDYVSRIGPRLFEGIETLAALIYPQESGQ